MPSPRRGNKHGRVIGRIGRKVNGPLPTGPVYVSAAGGVVLGYHRPVREPVDQDAADQAAQITLAAARAGVFGQAFPQ